MKTYQGWAVHHPCFLREEPKERTDLVFWISPTPMTFEPPFLFSTAAEAWATARRNLQEQRDQALKDLDLLARPYTSPQGRTYICSPAKLEEWRTEARLRLKIADAGLRICSTSEHEPLRPY